MADEATEGNPSYADLAALVAELRAEVAELREAVAARDVRIGELEKSLEQARRSNKRQAAPFSKGDPSDEPARPGRRSGKGHGRHGHRAVPARADRELEAPLPPCCPSCGGDVVHERDAEQWQTELPDARPIVTRFRVGVGRCRRCGTRVQGRHPEQSSDALGAAGSQLGPTAKAWAAWLHYELGLSFAKCARLLARLGVEATAGALCSGAQATGAALVPVQREIRRRVNESSMVVMDETGWRIGGRGVWLWVATTPEATAYNVADGRGFAEATVLVDEDYDGVIVRDGWAPYRRYAAAAHQSCLAHLLRRCKEMAEDNPSWARATPGEVKHILLTALAARDLPRRRRLAIAADLAERIELLAEAVHPYDANRKLVAHLSNEADALFAFLRHYGTDATNWRAEQAIRPAVVNRKVWGGNRTRRGADTQGRIMSVLRTATQQGIDGVDWLTRFARAPDLAVVPLFISR
ncbi:MAG: IS66 family transposase [Acidimicrobiales bacterium]